MSGIKIRKETYHFVYFVLLSDLEAQQTHNSHESPHRTSHFFCGNNPERRRKSSGRLCNAEGPPSAPVPAELTQITMETAFQRFGQLHESGAQLQPHEVLDLLAATQSMHADLVDASQIASGSSGVTVARVVQQATTLPIVHFLAIVSSSRPAGSSVSIQSSFF